MKTQLTATAAAAAIAMTGMSAAPANALTDQEMFLLLAGATAFALLSGASITPTPIPTPTPVTYSTGPITLHQTYTADFDHGHVGGAGTDLWFEAVDPIHRYLKPLNGAKMAVGNRSNRGFAGCSVASYSTARVSIYQVPVGSYVCMKTNQGRISQFRVNAITGGLVKTIHMGYTTWQ